MFVFTSATCSFFRHATQLEMLALRLANDDFLENKCIPSLVRETLL